MQSSPSPLVPSSTDRRSSGRPPLCARPSLTAIGRTRFAERHKISVRNPRPLGTNGYSTSWGTNAHGELSACPPGRS
ncbi:hypothetical protein ACIRPH_08975 [Nocardiopsis sp. NPDC101807]|uniref:hypothetical protein n=1 Tax=Nocardiopsis sp. NPDC101807 TaxID=3364339 RepID=UPI0037F736BF